jgi:hypothetical protein
VDLVRLVGIGLRCAVGSRFPTTGKYDSLTKEQLRRLMRWQYRASGANACGAVKSRCFTRWSWPRSGARDPHLHYQDKSAECRDRL